jgi:hypothetical protein
MEHQSKCSSLDEKLDQQSELIAFTLHSGAAWCEREGTHETEHRLGFTCHVFVAPHPPVQQRPERWPVLPPAGLMWAMAAHVFTTHRKRYALAEL